MARLILIRHGETDYNLQSRYCGFSNPPLNNKGIWQAKRLAVRLEDISIEKVYSSDSKRAYETAEIIFKNKPIERFPDFREMNFGIFEGLKYDEIMKKYPEIYKQWINSPKKTNIPGAETLSKLSKRVKEKVASILSHHKEKTIAIVTHAGPIRIILCDASKCGLEMFWQIKQDIVALNIIDYPEGSLAKVVAMNDTAHLFKEEVAIL